MTIKWPGEQTIHPIPATWSEELAFPECCRLLFCNEAPPGPNWPRQKRWGEGEEERRGGGGITRKSWHLPSAESLPSTACAQSRAEQSRGGGGVGKNKKRNRRDEVALIICVWTWTEWNHDALAGNYRLFWYEWDKYVKYAYLYLQENRTSEKRHETMLRGIKIDNNKWECTENSVLMQKVKAPSPAHRYFSGSG